MRKLDTKQSTISSSVVKKPPDPTEKGLLTLKSNACREINVKNSRNKYFSTICHLIGWIGHILRKPANNITRQALRWNPQGKRKRGRPRNSWRRGVESQMRNWGHTWATLGRFAQDRTRWRTEVVNGLCSNRS